jgi:ABC-type transport system involved in multi-copper enzyme maturation permease subunit
VEILHRRARILRLSITLAAVTVLCVGVLILGLFIAAFWQLQIVGLLVVIFCVAILGLIGSMVAFIADMNLALRAAQLDWQLIEKRVVR